MQRSERRTPSWLGGYAERRSISMMKHQNAKERAQNTKFYLNYAERRSISMMVHQMQRSERRAPSWLGGYAERRSGNLSYLRNLRAIEPLITHCQQ